MKIARIGLIAHEKKPEAKEAKEDLSAWLTGRGIDVVEDGADLLISLGGDGTMLKAAQEAHASDALLLGVNLGRVGYLTEVDMGQEKAALESIFAGDYVVEERMMLACRARAAGEEDTYVGLNEVLLERSSRQRLVSLEVGVGSDRLASFSGDGVLVATPTGSTAYALSAGGPIVSPRAECLVVVPVSAHMILARPFVFAADETVTLTVSESSDQNASLVIDGEIGRDLPPGAALEVSRHPRPLRLVRLSGPDFIARLRYKLDLPG